MDEIRKVAKAYYDGAAVSEKKLARQLFRSLDSNGDGKVSLREYKKMVKPSFSSNDLFRQLDANCDGTLDFDEVLALNYMDKVSVPRCNACNSLLLHSYFSCLPCQADVSYNLCCSCYSAGGDRFSHRHSSNNFVDTRAMLKLLDHLLKHAQITTNDGHKTHHHLQGAEDVGELEDVLIQGMALEEEAEDDRTEEDEDDDGEEEEEDEEEEDDDEEEEEEEVEVEVEGGGEGEDEEEDDDEEEGEDDDGDGDGDDEEVANGDKCEVLDRNLMNYGKAVYTSQPESKKSNGSTKVNSSQEKVLGAIVAVNNKVVCLKEKKKKVVLGAIVAVNNLKEKKNEIVLGSIVAVNNKVVRLKEKKKKIVLGGIAAVNNKVISFKEKKKKVKTVITVGTAVINIGAKAVASTLFHHVVRRRHRNRDY